MATAQKELHNQASNLEHHGKEMANDAASKAKEIGSTMAQKASEATSFVGKKADEATSAVGSGLKSVASTIRDKSPDAGMMHAAGAAVADTLEQGGRYLQEQGLSGIGSDLTNLIKRNPLPAVLLGVGVGFLLARALTSSRS